MNIRLKITLYLIAALISIAALSKTAASEKRFLTVGTKDFSEQKILANIMIALLEENGFKCSYKNGFGSDDIIRAALINKDIDLYMEYTGTGLMKHLKYNKKISNAEELYQFVKYEDWKQNKLIWLHPMPFNNTYCLIIRDADAKKYSIETISDFSAAIRKEPNLFILGISAEFYIRKDGFKALERTYNFRFPEKNIVNIAVPLLYNLLRDSHIDVIEGYSTDAKIEAYKLRVLKDDKFFFPIYNPAPVMRQETFENFPELTEILRKLSLKLNSEEVIRKMVYMVDIEKKTPSDTARKWLKEVGMISN